MEILENWRLQEWKIWEQNAETSELERYIIVPFFYKSRIYLIRKSTLEPWIEVNHLFFVVVVASIFKFFMTSFLKAIGANKVSEFFEWNIKFLSVEIFAYIIGGYFQDEIRFHNLRHLWLYVD